MKFSGSKLKQAMKEQGMSERALGRQIGRTRQTINSWILGNSVPNSNDLPNLSVALDRSVNYFLVSEDSDDARTESPSAATGAAGEPNAGSSGS
jgi:transcriptional regulator with XRE-family HTH domain